MKRKGRLITGIFWVYIFWPASVRAQTQLDLNVEFTRKYKAIDQSLNDVYQELVSARRTNSLSLKKLEGSERAWVRFRDAQINAIWPQDDKQTQYGSIWPVCENKALIELTQARIDQLKRMLKSEDGDDCSWN